MIAEVQTAKVKDDYDAKLSLIHRAFSEISRLCFEHDYHLTPEDWAALDAARLDDDGLSYDELRARLAQLYRRIKRQINGGEYHAESRYFSFGGDRNGTSARGRGQAARRDSEYAH